MMFPPLLPYLSLFLSCMYTSCSQDAYNAVHGQRTGIYHVNQKDQKIVSRKKDAILQLMLPGDFGLDEIEDSSQEGEPAITAHLRGTASNVDSNSDIGGLGWDPTPSYFDAYGVMDFQCKVS